MNKLSKKIILLVVPLINKYFSYLDDSEIKNIKICNLPFLN